MAQAEVGAVKVLLWGLLSPLHLKSSEMQGCKGVVDVPPSPAGARFVDFNATEKSEE